MNEPSTDRYKDIINTDYPFPSRRPRMSMDKRAAQFRPFAAMEGFYENYAQTELEQEQAVGRYDNRTY